MWVRFVIEVPCEQARGVGGGIIAGGGWYQTQIMKNGGREPPAFAPKMTFRLRAKY
jgi:hypothetical protein